jgi:hypothetical protein
VTVAADVTGPPTHDTVDYVLRIGGHEFRSTTPSVRLTPTEFLTAAGLPVVATGDRTVSYSFEVRDGHRVLASARRQLTFGRTDGTYAEATAPVVPATVRAGSPVTVHYDLTGVRGLVSPAIAVSTVGHWNPSAAPIFTPADLIPLTGTKGTVTVPAADFVGGGGVYGIGIVQDSTGTPPFGHLVYGEFASIRVDGGTAAQRPTTPTLSTNGGGFGHAVEVSRARPTFSLRYDVRAVPGATGAAVEVSAPAPTLFNALNTVTNANGTVRDNDGVDTGSVGYQRLSRSSGTEELNAVTLGIGGSLSYNVRVFAIDRSGRILGQASPTSLLTLDDGVAPGAVTSFAAQPSGQSVVAVRDAAGGESVREYQAATGTYGTVLASDSSPDNGYEVLGADPSAHRALVLHWQSSGDFTLDTYDTAKARLVAGAAGPAGRYTVLGGRVDATRHRALVLAHRTSDNADVVLPVDLTTGRLGTAVAADASGVKAGNYGMVDVDQKSGTALLSKVGGGLICFGFGGGVGVAASVDVDTGTTTPAASGDGCSARIAVDQGTETLYQLSYRSVSVNIAGTTNLIPVSGSPLTEGTPMAVRAQPALGLAVDSVHHLALVAFQTPLGVAQFGSINGAFSDNNATSQLAVVDLTTGRTVSLVNGFEFGNGAFGGEYDAATEQSIQLDPATRTGWTYSADGVQVQQFRY